MHVPARPCVALAVLGVVFECFDRRGTLRAICGGGRYDGLLTLYGSVKEVPCCGFGFGDCVIYELLKDLGKLPVLPRTVDFVVAAFNQDMLANACAVAAKLREGGASVDMLQEPKKKVAKAFDYADRAGATYIAFVAPDEWSQGCVRIKDLRNNTDHDSDAKGVDIAIDRLSSALEILSSSGTAGRSASPQSEVPRNAEAMPAQSSASIRFSRPDGLEQKA